MADEKTTPAAGTSEPTGTGTSEPTAPKTTKAKTTKKEAAPAAPGAAAAAKPTLSLSGTEAEKPKIIKAKGSKNVGTGIARVLATFNNTIVSISDLTGNVIGWSSAGKG